MRFSLAAAAAAVLVWSALATAQSSGGSEGPDTAANVFERRVPFQRYPRLGPRAVGLLMSRGNPWGYAGSLTRLGPRAARVDSVYQLYVEGRSGGSFILPAPGPGSDVVQRPRPVTLADGGTVSLWRSAYPGVLPELNAPAHLVRVTVNGGKGFYGNGAPYTDLEVLDGTADRPIVPARAMDEAKARWDRYLASQKGAFDRMVEQGRLRVEAEIAEDAQHEPDAGRTPMGPWVGGFRPGPDVAKTRAEAKYGPDEDTLQGGFFPSWRDDPGELTVLFGYRLSRQRIRKWMEMQYHPCPPGAPCIPPAMGISTQSKFHGAAIAYGITFDRTGKVIREEPFPPVPYSLTLTVPPMPGYPWHLPPTVQPPRGGRQRERG